MFSVVIVFGRRLNQALTRFAHCNSLSTHNMALSNSLCILHLAFATPFISELLVDIVVSFCVGFAAGFLINFLISVALGPQFVVVSVLHGVNLFVFLVMIPAWLAR